MGPSPKSLSDKHGSLTGQGITQGGNQPLSQDEVSKTTKPRKFIKLDWVEPSSYQRTPEPIVFKNVLLPKKLTPKPTKSTLESPFRTPPKQIQKSFGSPGDADSSPSSIFSGSEREYGTPDTVSTDRATLGDGSPGKTVKVVATEEQASSQTQARANDSIALDEEPSVKHNIVSEEEHPVNKRSHEGPVKVEDSYQVELRGGQPERDVLENNAYKSPSRTKFDADISKMSLPIESSLPRNLRDRRLGTAKGKHYFELATKQRGGPDGSESRRLSQPVNRELGWDDVAIPEWPQSAPYKLESSYGPFDIMFSDQEDSNATFNEKLEKRRQRLLEDLKRARGNTYIELKEGLYLPTALLPVIAKMKKGKPIKVADFDTDSKISSYDELQTLLEAYEAVQVKGSKLFSDFLTEGFASQAKDDSGDEKVDTRANGDEKIIRRSIGICLDLIRLNWDTIPDNEFYKVQWSIGGKFALPKFNFLRSKLDSKVANIKGLGSNILKWVLELLAFLFKAAGDYLMMPYREARRLVRSIRDTVKGIHVPVDHVGEECRRIWEPIAGATEDFKRKAGSVRKAAAVWSGDQANRAQNLGKASLQNLNHAQNLGKDSLRNLNPHRHLYWALMTLPLVVLWFLRDAVAVIPEVIDLDYGISTDNWTTQVKLPVLSTRGALSDTLSYFRQSLQDIGLLPFLFLGALTAIWRFRHYLWQRARECYTFIASLPTLRLASFTTKIGEQADAAKTGLQHLLGLLDISSKLRTIRGSLHWLVPFIVLVSALWRYGSLETAKEPATVAARVSLDFIGGVLETIAVIIESIPFESIRNILLDFWLCVLVLFYRWKDSIAPYIGTTSVLASIVIMAVILDQVFGSGHFWNFLLNLCDGILDFLSEIPRFFGWLLVNLTIISNHYCERLLETNMDIMNWTRNVYQTTKKKISAKLDFLYDLLRDCRDASWDRLKKWDKRPADKSLVNKKPADESLEESPESNKWLDLIKFIGMHAVRWLAQAAAVAAGVWFALLLCGICLSCSKDGCFTRGEGMPESLYDMWWSLQQTIALGMSQQKEVLFQIGNSLAGLAKRSELEQKVRDERDEMLAQTLKKVTQMLEEQKRGWSLERLFGS